MPDRDHHLDRRALIGGGAATALVVPFAASFSGNRAEEAAAPPMAPVGLALTAPTAVSRGTGTSMKSRTNITAPRWVSCSVRRGRRAMDLP